MNKITEDVVQANIRINLERTIKDKVIEGGVISISGSVSEKHYRPFKDCDELIEYWTWMLQ